MFVLEIDRPSPSPRDEVPALLEALVALGLRPTPERTSADASLVLAERAEQAVAAAAAVLEHTRRTGSGPWAVGMGIGTIDGPVPTNVHALRGPAVTAAREALGRAGRTSQVPVAITAAVPRQRERAQDAEAVMRLVGWMIGARSAGQWRVVEALRERPDATQAQLAAHLGVTQQTVSRSLRTSGWREESAASALLERLLAMVDLTSR